jgi:hypothetical protein
MAVAAVLHAASRVVPITNTARWLYLSSWTLFLLLLLTYILSECTERRSIRIKPAIDTDSEKSPGFTSFS